MSKQPLVSVIVPVYNVAAYLPRCIDSIIGQTYQNLEIILVDNAATKTCLSICEKYAAQDNRVKIVHLSKNIGPTGGRSAGITHATGDFIGFCDSDDWFKPDAIKTLLNLYNQTGADVLLGRHEFYQEGFSPWKGTLLRQRVKDPLHIESQNLIGTQLCWTGLYARKLFEKGLRFDARYSLGEDVDFVFQAALLANFTAYTDKTTYVHYMHPSSVAHTPNLKQAFDFMQVYLNICQFCKEHHLEKAWKFAHIDLAVAQSMFVMTYLLFDTQNNYTSAFKKAIHSLRQNLFDIFHAPIGIPGRCFMLFPILLPSFCKWFFRLPGVCSMLRKQFLLHMAPRPPKKLV